MFFSTLLVAGLSVVFLVGKSFCCGFCSFLVFGLQSLCLLLIIVVSFEGLLFVCGLLILVVFAENFSMGINKVHIIIPSKLNLNISQTQCTTKGGSTHTAWNF